MQIYEIVQLKSSQWYNEGTCLQHIVSENVKMVRNFRKHVHKSDF